MSEVLTDRSPGVLRIDLGRERDGAPMTGAILDACLTLLAGSDLTMVDLHGSPPETHRRFRALVILVRALRRRLLCRCNLAVAGQPDQADLPEFLADHHVEVIAALPGLPPFSAPMPSLVHTLRRFAAVGYGIPGSDLVLTLVLPVTASTERLAPAVATCLEALGVRFSGLHLASHGLSDGEDLVNGLQRLASAIPAGKVFGYPARSTLEVATDGWLTEVQANGTVLPLGRQVTELRALDDLSRPLGPPFGLTAAT